MLIMVTGSSCSGKTTLARTLDLPGVRVHDSDELGVPSGADKAWRQERLESWVQLALEYEATGTDLILTGQSPIGEVLAVPSAPRLSRIAVCLVDVEDSARWARLERRDPGKWTSEAKLRFVDWARWHRSHAKDPAFVPHALTDGGWPPMRWDRWSTWTDHDPRWQTHIFDTTERDVTDSTWELEKWVTTVREDPAWPLQTGWPTRSHGPTSSDPAKRRSTRHS